MKTRICTLVDTAIHLLRKTLAKRDGCAGLRAEGASAPQAGQARAWRRDALARRRRRRFEHQRKAVHAVTQTGRLRSVVEDVTEMAAAAAAVDFGAQHAEAAVLGLADGVVQRLP